jgi:hypothetical protein
MWTDTTPTLQEQTLQVGGQQEPEAKLRLKETEQLCPIHMARLNTELGLHTRLPGSSHSLTAILHFFLKLINLFLKE